MNNFDELTPEEQFIYEWQYHALGDFKSALMKAISLADKGNLFLLKIGFPIEVTGYELYTTKSGWWQNIEKKMEKENEK